MVTFATEKTFFTSGQKLDMLLSPPKRCKGYGAEAIQILVDYLFLYKDIPRIIIRTATRHCRSSNQSNRKSWIQKGRHNSEKRTRKRRMRGRMPVRFIKRRMERT